VETVLTGDFVDGPISRLRLLVIDIMIFLLQLTMLAITACTTPQPTAASRISAPVVSADLDRVERGVSTTSSSKEEGALSLHGEGYENIVVRVGVVETIRSLWDNDVPLVRRFR
jgi:hypothetical protein